MTQRARQVTQRARQVTQRARQVTQRARQVTQRARQVTQRARQVTQRARQVTQRARQVTQRARQVTQRARQVITICQNICMYKFLQIGTKLQKSYKFVPIENNYESGSSSLCVSISSISTCPCCLDNRCPMATCRTVVGCSPRCRWWPRCGTGCTPGCHPLCPPSQHTTQPHPLRRLPR